jgi:hypothetical protein
LLTTTTVVITSLTAVAAKITHFSNATSIIAASATPVDDSTVRSHRTVG